MVERIRTLLETRQLTPTQFADLIGVARPIVSHVLSGRNKPSLEVVQRILAAMPELAMPWLLNGSGPMLAPAVPAGAGALAEGTVIPVPALAPAEPVLAVPVSASSEDPALMVQPTSSAARQEESSSLLQVSDKQADEPRERSAVTQEAPISNSAGKHLASAVEPHTRAGKPLPFKANQYKPAARPKRFVAAAAPCSGSDGGTNEQGSITQNGPVVLPAGPSPAIMTPELAVAPEPTAPLAPVQPPVAADSGPIAVSAAPEGGMAQALFAGAEKPIRRIVIFYHDGSFADYQPE